MSSPVYGQVLWFNWSPDKKHIVIVYAINIQVLVSAVLGQKSSLKFFYIANIHILLLFSVE